MILEIILISIVGTLLHFTYEWSGHNKVVALFSAVNESTWEHIKIALTATFLFSVIDGALYGYYPNFFAAKFLSFLSIIILIPVLFYSYTFFTKKSILPVDIVCFYVVITVSQIIYRDILALPTFGFYYQYLSVIGIFVIFAFYMSLTMLPIKNFLCKDPITKKYGLRGHSHEK